MLERLAGRHVVQSSVAQRPGSDGQLGEYRPDDVALEPVQRGGWPVNGGERVVQDLEFWADCSGGIGEECVELLVQTAAAAGAGGEPSGGAAAGARRPEARLGNCAVGA
jgi:hypothetical protein